MTGCSQEFCVRESEWNSTHQDTAPIADSELVSRSGNDPMHRPKGKWVKSVIKKSDLRSGALSIWRSENNPRAIEEVARRVSDKYTPDGQTLHSLLGVPAIDIRRFTIDDRRVFCLIADTRVDDNDHTDSIHAVLALCKRYILDGSEESEVAFNDAANNLFSIISEKAIWSKAAA